MLLNTHFIAITLVVHFLATDPIAYNKLMTEIAIFLYPSCIKRLRTLSGLSVTIRVLSSFV